MTSRQPETAQQSRNNPDITHEPTNRRDSHSRLATLRFVHYISLTEASPAWSVLAETEQRLPALACKPMMFGWGAEDFVFNDEVLDKWREIFPDPRIEYFEDAGHYGLRSGCPHPRERRIQHAPRDHHSPSELPQLVNKSPFRSR
jgi:pimeloyl-ACP methyl ester carboxylesterase